MRERWQRTRRRNREAMKAGLERTARPEAREASEGLAQITSNLTTSPSLTTYDLRLTTYYLLLTTYYLLPTTFYLLLLIKPRQVSKKRAPIQAAQAFAEADNDEVFRWIDVDVLPQNAARIEVAVFSWQPPLILIKPSRAVGLIELCAGFYP